MIRFILADLRRLWAGAVMVVLLVALSTALGVTVNLQERALRLGSARAADRFDLVVGAAGSETQLVLSSVFLQSAPLPLVKGDVLMSLVNDDRVAWAAPVGFGDSFAGYPIVGTTSTLIDNMGNGFSQGQVFVENAEAVIGSAVDLPIGAEIKPLHGTAAEGGHTHTEIAYRVTGQLKPTGTPWDRAIMVPIRAVWHIHGMEDGHDHEEHDHAHEAHDEQNEPQGEGLNEIFGSGTPGIPAILVKPKTIADAYKLRQEYRKENTLGVFPGEVLTKLYATLGDARKILSVISYGAQGLVAASLILVTLVHISQRRRQIGALRAFGAPRMSVSMIVWAELFLLFTSGIALGFATGFAAAKIITATLMAESGITMPVEFARSDIWQAILLLVIAAVFAALPAWLAYRQSPAQALRT
jgi:putative ABC transport system permease protein